jgi:cobalamin biosynthesis Mg chelatase CobN
MSRTVKNVLCALAMAALAAAGICTASKLLPSRHTQSMRDESFGGFEEDLDRGFDFDEDDVIEFEEHNGSFKAGKRSESKSESQNKEDTHSSATEEESSDDKSSSKDFEISGSTEKTSVQTVAAETELNVTEMKHHSTTSATPARRHKTGTIVLLAVEVVAFVLIGIWLIVSKGNKKSFKEVFGKKNKDGVIEGQFEEKVKEEKTEEVKEETETKEETDNN